MRSVNHSRDATCLGFNGCRRCRADSCLTLTEQEACERRPVCRLTERRASYRWVRRLTGKRANCTLCMLTGKRALWLPWPPALLASSPLMAPNPPFNLLFKYKTLIANVLVRTPVCKPTASPGSQEKMCRAGFLQLLIANNLDRTPVCKVRATQDFCIPWMQTVVLDDPCATTYKKFGKIFASVLLGMLPFVKLERLTFVDLVTLPFVNLVTLWFVKIWS